jgi:Integrase core domain
MGSTGDCFDNACCETFHATLKKERIYRQSWPTRAAARSAIFEYIEGWYNPRRRHSTLGYRAPAEFEQTSSRARSIDARDHDFGRWIGRGDLPQARRRPDNASHLARPRRFRRQPPDLDRERSRCSNGVGSGRHNRGHRTNDHGRPLRRVAKRNMLTDRTSKPKVKTCRPNRGRSKRSIMSSLLHPRSCGSLGAT